MKRVKLIAGLCGVSFSILASALPILSIVPSISSTTVRRDSETQVAYLVTNNTNQPINGLSILPSFQTTGEAAGIHLGYVNTCTGTLAATGSCYFDTLIQGANQPPSFQITPQVCGYGGAFCAVPDRSNYLEVNVNAANPAYAYFAVSSGNNINKVVPINATTLQVGTPFQVGVGYTLENAVAVSPDGTRVYFGEQEGNDSTVVILSAGANPQLIQNVALGYFPYFDALAVTPNGKTIYVTASESQEMYRIDNNAGVYTPTSILLPNGDSASNVVVSPDGQKVFITSYGNNEFYVMDADSNLVTQTLTNTNTSCGFNAPGSVVVTPEGNTVYVADGYGAEGISVIEKNAEGTYVCAARITEPTAQLAGMALTPDGRYLYAVGYNSPQLLYIIDTSTNTLISSRSLPNGSLGVSITPDGSKLFISNHAASDSYFYMLDNDLPTTQDPTAVNIGGGTQTEGNFAG